MKLVAARQEKGETADLKGKLKLSSWHGAWERGKSAGGCRNSLLTFVTNPQFRVVVPVGEQPRTVLISLLQKVGQYNKPTVITFPARRGGEV